MEDDYQDPPNQMQGNSGGGMGEQRLSQRMV